MSVKPIPGGEIERKIYGKGNRNSDVYRVIHDLAGTYSKNILLTSWNDIRSKYDEQEFKLDFLRKLCKLFQPYLSYIEKTIQKKESAKSYNTPVDSWNEVFFSIWEDVENNRYYLDIRSSYFVFNRRNLEKYRNKMVTKDNIQLSFEFDFEKGKGNGLLKTWLASEGIPLKITFDEFNKDFNIYVSKSDTIFGVKMNRTRFLETAEETSKLNFVNINDRILNPSEVRITRGIFDKGAEEFSEVVKELRIENGKNYRYYLNLRGFLLYLLGIESQNTTKIKKNQNDRKEQRCYQTNKKIDGVIKALTENEYTKKDYPFLWNYQILDKIEGKYFKVELLKRIAFEAQSMLLRENDNFLKYWVTSQFHAAISRIYGSLLAIIPGTFQPQDKNINLATFLNWIDEYDKKMLEYSLHYLRREETLVKSLLELKAKSKNQSKSNI